MQFYMCTDSNMLTSKCIATFNDMSNEAHYAHIDELINKHTTNSSSPIMNIANTIIYNTFGDILRNNIIVETYDKIY